MGPISVRTGETILAAALRPGDFIYTGTPEGVGAVEPSDQLHGHIDGVGEITGTIG